MPRPAKYDERQQMKIGNEYLAADAAGRRALGEKYDVSKATLSRYSSKAEKFQTGGGLFSETGTSGLTRFGGSIQEDYDDDWNSLVDMVALVKEMLNHPIVSATMYALEISLKRVEWSVIPGGESEIDLEVAEFVETNMHDMSHSWEDHISQLSSMFHFGFAPFEIVYKRRLGPDNAVPSQFDDGRIGWRKLAFRSQDTLAAGNEWEFADDGGIKGLNQQAPPDWTPKFIPMEKMILYRTTAAKNNPQGLSLLRRIYIPWYYSKNISEIEGIAAERVGAGIPVMYLGDGTSLGGGDSDIKFAKQIVRDTRSDEQEGIVIPHPKQTADGRGALFELVSPPSRGLIDFEATIERYNKQISQTLLAQFLFLGLVKHGTQGLASVMVDFFAESVEGWLITISSTMNRFLIPKLIRLNGFSGLTKYPQIEPGDVGETDMATLLEAVERAVASGTLIPDEGTERRVRQVLRVPTRDSTEAGALLMDLPGGKQPVDPNAMPFGGGDDLAVLLRREQFAKVRGRGARAAMNWERYTNDYQRSIDSLFTELVSEMSEDLEPAGDEGFQEEIAVAAIARFSERLNILGNQALLGIPSLFETEGALRSDGEEFSVISSHLGNNQKFVRDSLAQDMGDRIKELLRQGLPLAVVMASFRKSFRSRSALYAGEVWGAINEVSGVRSIGKEDGRIYWRRDPQAEHCDTCLDHGEQEYASFDAMLAITGEAMPGVNTTCDGNCRCSLETVQEDGLFGRD